jgi:hypothetical protein
VTSTSADRMRAYRLRRRERCILVQLDITADGAHALQSLGWLIPAGARDTTAIANAILALAGAVLTKGLRPADLQRVHNGRDP